MNNFKKCIFLPFIALCSFHTYAANSPLAQELKTQASGECTEYYYISTDELYNLGFSLVY